MRKKAKETARMKEREMLASENGFFFFLFDRKNFTNSIVNKHYFYSQQNAATSGVK